MPLTWSEARKPNEECGYDHAVSETPLGQLRIEWKGWKDYPSPMCEMPWREIVVADNLENAKQGVQQAWDKMATLVVALQS